VDATREKWRPVVGFEGFYEVSDQGRVKSLDRVVDTARGPRKYSGRMLKLSVKKTGYLSCVLWICQIAKHVSVHTLVLESFVGLRPAGMECCHNDGDRANARLSNLRWDTHSENVYDSVRSRTMYQSAKTRCPRGHLYDSSEVGKNGGRHRGCSQCRNEKRLLRLSTPRKWDATHCVNGHEYTAENTYMRRGGGARSCRTCNRERMRKSYQPMKGTDQCRLT
jgi:hypothetical protein